jgi:hypothetical protein
MLSILFLFIVIMRVCEHRLHQPAASCSATCSVTAVSAVNGQSTTIQGVCRTEASANEIMPTKGTITGCESSTATGCKCYIPNNATGRKCTQT